MLACATLTWSERGGGAPGGGAASLVSEAWLTAMLSTSLYSSHAHTATPSAAPARARFADGDPAQV